MNTLVTIGLPVYKTDFLDNAVKSVLNQTYEDFQLLILNDNPESLDLKKKLLTYDDPRIRILENQKNIGRKNIVECWNKLLNLTETEFFILFSDDDVYESNFLEELIYLAKKYPSTDIFHSRVQIIDENNNVKYISSTIPEFESGLDFIWHKIKNYRFSFVGDFLVRTEALKKIGGFVDLPNAWGSDDLTWFKISLINGIAGTPKILFNWRESNLNISKVGNIQKKFEAINKFFVELRSLMNNFIPKNKFDEILLSEIIKNLDTRKFTLEGHTLKQVANRNKLDFLKILFLWVKLKKRFNVSFKALVWSGLLFYKDINRRI